MYRLLPLLLAIYALPLSAQRRVEPARHDSSFFLEDETDKFTGATRLMSRFANLSGLGSLSTTGVSVGWRMVVPEGGVPVYMVRLEYYAQGWHFIPEDGIAFALLADTLRVPLAVMGQVDRKVRTGRWVSEVAMLEVSPTQMFAIARANAVSWRLYGKSGYIGGEAKPGNFDKLRTFLATVFPDSALYEKKK